MNVELFQRIADYMLKKHYGITLDDTYLHKKRIVAECINQGFRPYQVLNEHADESDIVRIDKEGLLRCVLKSATRRAG